MGRVISVALQFKDAFTNPSKKTIESLRTMGREAQKSGKSIQSAGNTIASAGASLTKSITLPIAGVAAAAVKTAADYESAMSNVKAITGATGEDFKKLEQLGKDLGKSTAWSASEVAQAMQYTGMAGWSAQDNIDGLAGVLNAASATGTDLALTSNIMTDAISAFGNTAKDAGMYADVMTKACTSANVSVETLGESYKYAGAVCGTMKYSVQDATTALAAMGNQGIKGSSAGTALKNAITNMAAPTDNMAKAMKTLGISIKNNDGTMKSLDEVISNCRKAFGGLSEDQQAAYASAIFGKQAMAGMLSVINTSQEEYDKLGAAIKNSSGAAQEAADTQLNNLNGQITLLKSALEGAAITIGDKLLPYIKKGTEIVQELTDRFNNLSDSQVDVIMKVAGVAAAIGPCIMIFGKTVTSVGRAVSTFGKISAAISKAGSIMALITSPAGIAIAAVAGIAVAGLLLIKNWDKVKVFLGKVGNWFKEAFSKAGVPVEIFVSKFKEIGVKIGGFVSTLGQKVQEIVPVIKEKFGGAIQKALPIIQNGFVSAIKFAIPIVNSLIKMVKQVAPSIEKFFVTAIKATIPIVKSLENAIRKAAPIIGKIFLNAFKAIQPVIQKASSVIQRLAPIIAKVLIKAINTASTVIQFLGKVCKSVFDVVGKVIVKGLSIAQKAFNVATKVISVATSMLRNVVQTTFKNIASYISIAVDTVRSVIDGMKQVFSGITDFISGVFTGNWSKAWEGVREIFKGIFSSLAALCKAPINAVIAVINGAISGINKVNVTVPDWVPGLGGKSLGFNIPTIPQLYRGTDNWKGGLVQTQERGGEIMDLPKGTRVYPHDKSIDMARKEGAKSASKSNNITININKLAEKMEVRSEKDIDSIVEALATKLQGIALNMA